MATILSIAPYKYLKPRNGGHWGIYAVDKVFSVLNNVFTLSVQSNEAFESPFTQVNIIADKKSRYLPFKLTSLIVEEARKVKAQLILCHHPYLYFAVKRAASVLGIPFFIRSHNIESERFKSMGKPWWSMVAILEKKAYQKAKSVFYVTEEDAQWGQQHYDIPAQQSIVLPYPISSSSFQMTEVSKQETAALHKIDADVPWYCFMGDLSYAPNEDAVSNIVYEIYSRLKAKNAVFEILICGKGLSQEMQEKIKSLTNVHYLGFVDDLKSILNHASLMLNAVIFGGGVKVKVLEALSENLKVISTENGALGIHKTVCGNKLQIVADKDWDAFTQAILQSRDPIQTIIPKAFFDYYYFKNVAERIQDFL